MRWVAAFAKFFGMDTNLGEWSVIEKLLPEGWERAARTTGAFQRVRYTKTPSAVLRLLLFHAAGTAGLRSSATMATAAGITSLTGAALHKRLRKSERWLEWICAEMCRSFRDTPVVPGALRLRVIDSTVIQGPGSTRPEWRLHYTVNLRTLGCDWHELTTCKVGEAVERAPIQANDVILGDRNFCSERSMRWLAHQGAFALVRLRWCHGEIQDAGGRPFALLQNVKKLHLDEVGEWTVKLPAGDGKEEVSARIVAVRLPAPLALKAEQKARRKAAKKGKRVDPRTIEAAHFVMLFTTIPATLLNAEGLLALYRYRWQIELAFKRLKQLLRLGNLPHKAADAARAWILAKLALALLIEKLYRGARSFFPWGYPIRTGGGDQAAGEPVAMDPGTDRCDRPGAVPSPEAVGPHRGHRLPEARHRR